FPPFGPEAPLPLIRLVEDQAASGLMLWTKRNNRRRAHQARQPLWIARREAVIVPGNNLIQFIQRVAVRAPGFSLLIRAKQIAGLVERQRVRNPNSSGDCLKSFRAR